MASLSDKLAGIELNAFAHGKHLGSINGKVTIVDEDLERRNFRHAGERLCELWDMIRLTVILLLLYMLRSMISLIF